MAGTIELVGVSIMKLFDNLKKKQSAESCLKRYGTPIEISRKNCGCPQITQTLKKQEGLPVKPYENS